MTSLIGVPAKLTEGPGPVPSPGWPSYRHAGHKGRWARDLRQHDDVGGRALELAIPCASRSDEVLKARWDRLSG